MNQRRYSFLSNLSAAAAALVVLLWLGGPDLVWGQVPGQPRSEDDPFGQRENNQAGQDVDEQILQDTFIQAEQSVFVSAPREFIRPLIRANRAIRENDPARAVSLLGEVLNDSTNEDFLVPVLGTEGLSVSLRLRAQSILGSLPTKDRELYRLRYGVQAKQLLAKAVEQGDFESVSQVMQRFFFTRAGFDAAMLLGHHHLDQGRPIAAANCFRRIVDSEEARLIHDPEASVLLAACWLMGESDDRATEVLMNLRRNSNKNTIEFLGEPVRLFDKPENALPWLINLVGESPLRSIESVNQWLMAGGNPQRNARHGQGVPLINPRWETPTLNNPDMEKVVLEYQRDLVFLESAPIPAVQPLAIGNTIVMRAFDRMIGVDFETGKRVWVFPPWDFASNFADPKDVLETRTIDKAPLSERLWLDAVYGQASSDGKSIFVVPDPGFSRDAGIGITRNSEPVVARLFNELMSIDIQREGAFRWEVGGENGLDEPKLAKSFFLGPPLPLGDELFAVCQQEKLILLVVLDAETGRLKWQQALGTTENNSVRLVDDRFRRLAGVSPSFANGVLVCATGNGALTAVDLSTRSLLWGYQYTTAGRKPVQRISPRRTSNADPFGGIWRDASILISNGKVLFTPVEAQDLVCVDLQTGYPAWENGKGTTAKFPRNDSLFLACVENGLAILVGETSVRAVNVNSGKSAWELPLEDYGKPSGRGYANDGYYYFPVTSEKLLQVDLKAGKIVKAVRTDGVLGNLICHRGDVISHGVERLASFPQDEPNRRLLAEAETRGELSPDLLAIKSQLQIQDGNLRAAVESIQQAYDQQPNRAYEKILLDLVLRLVEEDFDFGIQLAERYRAPLLANRRYDFLAANVNGMVRKRDFDSALDALLELMRPLGQLSDLRRELVSLPVSKYDRIGGDELSAGTRRGQAAGSGRERIEIRLDQWIASRITFLYTEGTSETRQKIELSIEELLATIVQAGLGPEVFRESLIELHDTLRMFPAGLVPADSRLELARKLVDQHEPLRATQLLDSLDSAGDTELSTARLALKAEIGKKGPSAIERTPIGAGWNRGEVKATQEKTSPESGLFSCTVHLSQYDSNEYTDYQYRFYGQTGEIEILDANGISAYRFFARQKVQTLNTAYNNHVFGRISFFNHLAVLDIATEIFVFDWLKLKNGEDPMLWNIAIRGGARNRASDSVSHQWGEVKTTTASRGYESRVYVGAPGFDGICYIENTQLICLDPFSGERNWQRSGVLPDSILFGDDQHTIIWNSKFRVANIIDTKTGQLVKTSTLDADAGAVWTTRGTRVLVSTLRKRKLEPLDDTGDLETELRKEPETAKNDYPIDRSLGLYDLLTGEFVWDTIYPLKTRGCLVGQDRIAILRPQQDLEMIDLQTGELKFTSQLDLEDIDRRRVTGVGVALRAGKYLIHLKKGDTPNRVDVGNMEIKYLNYSDVMWVGHLVCIDSATGKNVWRRSVRFDNFQIGQGQPVNLPVYLLTRRIEKNDETGARHEYINFVGVDMESGDLKFNELAEYNYRLNAQISCDPENQEMKIEYFANRLLFKFLKLNDDPPKPITHLTNYNSVRNVVRPQSKTKFDKSKFERSIAASLEKAIEAQKRLPQKQAEERKRLESEKSGDGK